MHGEPESTALFSETIGRRFGLDTHIAVLNETVTLGLPVKHRRIVTERLRDPRQAIATYALDTLQTEFIAALERLKRDIGRARSKQELDDLLASMPGRLNREANDLLDHHQLPET